MGERADYEHSQYFLRVTNGYSQCFLRVTYGYSQCFLSVSRLRGEKTCFPRRHSQFYEANRNARYESLDMHHLTENLATRRRFKGVIRLL